eukprot:588536-Rhodomonas_salina.1
MLAATSRNQTKKGNTFVVEIVWRLRFLVIEIAVYLVEGLARREDLSKGMDGGVGWRGGRRGMGSRGKNEGQRAQHASGISDHASAALQGPAASSRRDPRSRVTIDGFSITQSNECGSEANTCAPIVDRAPWRQGRGAEPRQRRSSRLRTSRAHASQRTQQRSKLR